MFQVYHSGYSGCCLGIWGHDLCPCLPHHRYLKAGVVKGLHDSSQYILRSSGADVVNHRYFKGDGLGLRLLAPSSATNAKRNA
ncbi:hypothetical protein CDL15_Pgr006115 [Punica granatum]|uniref:Uncharacterized protein n=1 Tax=Punica granatum TaxID=22663 RepID=A0A218VU36_PUNGR|nr:hypothetical protein CDL15_Pgr006115 [Punica granatum]